MKKRTPVLTMFALVLFFIMGGIIGQAEAIPTADAGPDMTITTNDVSTTIIMGYITDPDYTGYQECYWTNSAGVDMTPAMQVGPNGECPLDLSASPIVLGDDIYTMKLVGSWPEIAIDTMILTIVDPNAALADAGPDMTITTDDVATTIIMGYITDPDYTGYQECYWTNSAGVDMTPTMQVGPNGECPLDLSTSPIVLGADVYTMTLVGSWPEIAIDTMMLTIVETNAAPFADAGADVIITTDDVATTIITGYVTDPDNTGGLECYWTNSAGVDMTPQMLVGPNGECPLDLSASPIVLGADVYTMRLVGWDGSAVATDTMILTIVESNAAPLADAGDNVNITTEEIASTIIQGIATDADSDPLQCRWITGGDVLQDWGSVGVNGECPLYLSTLSIGIGTYSLFLEVDDGQTTSADEMILTMDNSAPHTAPGGGGVFEINTPVVLIGDISDFDGDLLSYQWIEGATNVICSGTVQAIAEGTPIMVPDCSVSNLSLGMHTISLQADDGVNLPDTNHITIEIVDTTVPVLAPISSQYLLWPPNHNMVNIVISANASDNSGLPVTLNAIVASNEPEDGLGDGDTGPDSTVPVIDLNTGMIDLQLRRERSGSGNGRIYTITITATDASGLASTADLKIKVPHDKGKKK